MGATVNSTSNAASSGAEHSPLRTARSMISVAAAKRCFQYVARHSALDFVPFSTKE